MTTLLDRSQIEEILPHRAPFLFVDAITDIVPGERISGTFLVRSSERFLSKVRPSAPSLPSTILTEAMAQVGAILVLHPEENRGRTIYFRAIEEAEFRQSVPVGATVRVEARVRKLRARYGTLAVEAFVDSDLAARAVMSFALG